jgi:predicted patatin/cPLA2 family phospholipase
MVAALERLGLTDAFDLVVGSSAGAINGAAFLARAGERASDAYCGPLASRSFVNPLRVLRGKPVLDVNDVLDLVYGGDVSALAANADSLHCIALDIDTAEAVDLHGTADVWQAVLASSRMPWAGGPPIEIDGHRYLDGGMASPVPVAEAIAAGATHVLALQTRPFGIPRKSASRVGDYLIERHLRSLNPALVTLYRERITVYEQLVADLERRSSDYDAGPPHVLGLRPVSGTPCVGQLERRGEVLTQGAEGGALLVTQTFSRSSATAQSPR